MDRHYDCGCDKPSYPCEKYLREARIQEEKAFEARAKAEKVKDQALSIECEINALLAKVRELEERSDELWEKYDELECASFDLLDRANENLERYIECKDDQRKPVPPKPCPPDPCHQRPCHERPCHERPCTPDPCHERPCHQKPCSSKPCQKIIRIKH